MKFKYFTVLLALLFIITTGNRAYSYVTLPSWTFWPGSQADFWFTQYGGGNPSFDSAFHEAILLWNNHSNFSYTPQEGSNFPCDGSGNGWYFSDTLCGEAFGGSTLAVTISQVRGGQKSAPVIFNSAWTWGIFNGVNGRVTDFRRVAAHELGHAAGLDHSADRTALMAPFYSNTIETPQADDLDGLRSIYGGDGQIPSTPTQPATTGSNETQIAFWTDVCTEGSIAIHLDGDFAGSLTQCYASGKPDDCNATGTVTTSLSVGSHTLLAVTNSGVTWRGTIDITDKGCWRWLLYCDQCAPAATTGRSDTPIANGMNAEPASTSVPLDF